MIKSHYSHILVSINVFNKLFIFQVFEGLGNILNV